MDRVFVGKLVTTHGIKGEVRILSSFQYKDRVFKIGNCLFIGNESYKITSYRVHKGYDMVTFEGINDISEVIHLKGMKVYVDRSILSLSNNEYILDDLLNMDVILNDEHLGKVVDYNDRINKLIEINGNVNFYIPLNGNFIDEIDIENNKIIVNESVRGLYEN